MSPGILIVLVLLLFIWLPVSAAEIYGRVWVAPKGRPAVDATVTIDCDGASAVPARVDRYGRYRSPGVASKRNCRLSVEYQGKSSSRPIVVYSGTGSRSANIELRVSQNDIVLIRR